MIYTVDQLIEDFRSDVFDVADVDDSGAPRDTLWSDADALRYLNSAAARLASDTLSIVRRFEYPVLAGGALVRFPFDEVLDMLEVSFSIPGLGRRRRLREFDIDHGICSDDYGVRTYNVPDLEAIGQPSYYTRDYDQDFMRLWHVPYMPGTLTATAIVVPTQLHAGMPLPFKSRKDFDLLLMWMKKMAYAKQDADTFDLQRSESFEQEYQRYMPDRRSEVDRIRRAGGFVRAA